MTTRCLIVFVAVDDAGDRVKVTAWEPETEEDLSFQKYALNMVSVGKEQDKDLMAIELRHQNLNAERDGNPLVYSS